MAEINGKQVIFKDTLAASEWWPLLPTLQAMAGKSGGEILSMLELPTVYKMVAGAVKSWEFDGDPSNAEDVGKLDTFKELIPLIGAISQYVGKRTSSLGESGGEST